MIHKLPYWVPLGTVPAQERAYLKNDISHIRVMRLKSTMSLGPYRPTLEWG